MDPFPAFASLWTVTRHLSAAANAASSILRADSVQMLLSRRHTVEQVSDVALLPLCLEWPAVAAI